MQCTELQNHKAQTAVYLRQLQVVARGANFICTTNMDALHGSKLLWFLNDLFGFTGLGRQSAALCALHLRPPSLRQRHITGWLKPCNCLLEEPTRPTAVGYWIGNIAVKSAYPSLDRWTIETVFGSSLRTRRHCHRRVVQYTKCKGTLTRAHVLDMHGPASFQRFGRT
jgi:hypothetical protein